jgi:TonB family protein
LILPVCRSTGIWLDKRLTSVLLAGLLAALFSSLAKAEFPQEKDHSSSEKRVVNRIEPEYPETLKRLYIGGIVRIQVTVDPSGRVASTELLGGSPILGQSAMKAVKRWKYVPAANTEKFVVQLEFDPHR